MSWVDLAIVAVVTLSAVIGFFRGLLREAISLATWILALYLAFVLARPGAAFLQTWIATPSLRLAVAFAAIFVGVLIVGGIINYIVGRLVGGTGFAGTDRVLGGAFGILRGIGVLIALVLLAGVTPVPRDAWWQQSLFMGRLEDGAVWVRGFLPADLAGAVTYPDQPDAPGATPTAPEDSTLSMNGQR